MPDPKKWDEDTNAPTFGDNIPNPTAPGATYVQAEAQSTRNAVIAILDVLRAAGLIQQD
jgi:hypothetical protein